MVIGMATAKVTITLQNGQIEEIRALVAAGEAASVSAQRAGQAVITSDAGDLRRIAPGLQLIVI